MGKKSPWGMWGALGGIEAHFFYSTKQFYCQFEYECAKIEVEWKVIGALSYGDMYEVPQNYYI